MRRQALSVTIRTEVWHSYLVFQRIPRKWRIQSFLKVREALAIQATNFQEFTAMPMSRPTHVLHRIYSDNTGSAHRQAGLPGLKNRNRGTLQIKKNEIRINHSRPTNHRYGKSQVAM